MQYQKDWYELTIKMDHKKIYDSLNSILYSSKNLLTNPDAFRHLFLLRTSFGNKISSELFKSSTSTEEKNKLIDLIKSKDTDRNTIFNIDKTRTNNDFFIDLLEFLKTHYQITPELANLNLADGEKTLNNQEQKTKLHQYKENIKAYYEANKEKLLEKRKQRYKEKGY